MKITKRQLRRIIKEEKARILAEQAGGDYDEGTQYADDDAMGDMDAAMNELWESIFFGYSEATGDADRAKHLAKTVVLELANGFIKDTEDHFEERFGS